MQMKISQDNAFLHRTPQTINYRIEIAQPVAWLDVSYESLLLPQPPTKTSQRTVYVTGRLKMDEIQACCNSVYY